ncbi:hypothetical protein [Streptomyces shaanxiensis]
MDEEAITIKLTHDRAFVLSGWPCQVMFQSDDLEGIVHDRAIASPIYAISGTSRTWCRASIIQWLRMSSARWAAVACSAVRLVTAYTGFEGGLAGLAVGAVALDLDGLAGSGEEEAVHGGGLDPADLGAAVAAALGASLQRDPFPGKGLELSAQLLLVAFDDQHVVGASGEEVAGARTLRGITVGKRVGRPTRHGWIGGTFRRLRVPRPFREVRRPSATTM